jgi:hypothetical protein
VNENYALLPAFLACALVTSKHVSLANSTTSVETQQEESPPLRRTLKVIGSECCVGDAELDGLHLKALSWCNRDGWIGREARTIRVHEKPKMDQTSLRQPTATLA